LASLGASIGLFETVVGNWREVRRVPRQRGAVAIGVITFMIAVIPALSSNVLSNVKIGSRGLLAFLDAGLINWCLPISALMITQVAIYLLRVDLVAAEFVDPKVPGSAKFHRHWLFVLKYLATPTVLAVLIMQVVSLF
jgi:SNF family Na+-dependent transporter